MKVKRKEITREDIHEHWRQGKSSMDWRHLETITEKREWLMACLYWTGLPTAPIPAFNYIIDGSQVTIDLDFYCLIGETFFGYRGYFGQDLDGWYDCFCEVYMYEKTKALVENGAKVIIKNSDHLKEVLDEGYFIKIIEGFKENGFVVELE